MTYDIYTFGNGDILEGVFNAIAMTINANSGSLFVPLKRIGLMVGVLWALISALYSDQVRVFTHWIVPMTVILNLFFIPTTSVWIHDPVTKYHQKVDHIPYGLAAFAGYISKIGYHITEQVEKVFSMPDDLKYQKSGSIFASTLIQQAKTFHITHEDLAENMRGFVTQCVLYDAMLGRKYTLKELRNSPDIWNLVSTKASPVRSLMWRDINTSKTEIITCQEAVTKFNTLWNSELDQAGHLYGKKLFGKHTLINPKVELFKYLPLSYATLGNMAKSAEEILKQNMMINAISDGIESKSLELGNHFASKRAYLQQRSTYETLGHMAGETLPTMKAVLEAIAYSFFIFVVPLSFLPFGWRILMSWGQIILWLQMWAPLYAILNFIMTMSARSKTLAQLSLSNEAGVTLATSTGIANLNADISAMSGYLAMSIPFLCIALVKGLESFVHMASHLGNVSQSSASLGASEVTSGNFNYGNLSTGNSQIANTNMLNQSMSGRYQASSFQMMDGRTDVSTMSDGSQVINVGTSNLPLSLNVAETQSAQFSQMASQSEQNALQLSESSTQNLADSYRSVVDLSHALGKSENLSESLQKGLHTEDMKAINKSAQMIEDFAKNNNISVDKSAALFAEASANGDLFFFKGSGGMRGNVSAQDQELLTKAKRMSESQDFQESYRSTLQASKNLSSHFSDEKTQRLSQNISDSYERGNSLRDEASKSYRKSEDYAHQAQQTQAQSSSINANYNQEFMDWLSHQKADQTAGNIGRQGAAHILANDPQARMNYAKQFMDEKGLIPQTSTSLLASSVRKNYEMENQHKVHEIPHEKSINFNKESTGHRTFKQGVESEIENRNHIIDQRKNSLQNARSSMRQNIQESQGKSVAKKAVTKGKKELTQLMEEGKEWLSGESQKK